MDEAGSEEAVDVGLAIGDWDGVLKVELLSPPVSDLIRLTRSRKSLETWCPSTSTFERSPVCFSTGCQTVKLLSWGRLEHPARIKQHPPARINWQVQKVGIRPDGGVIGGFQIALGCCCLFVGMQLPPDPRG